MYEHGLNHFYCSKMPHRAITVSGLRHWHEVVKRLYGLGRWALGLKAPGPSRPQTLTAPGVLVTRAVLVEACRGFVGRILTGRFQTSVSTVRLWGPCQRAHSDWSAGIT